MTRLPAVLSRRRRAFVIGAVVVAIGIVTFLTVRAGTRSDDLVPAVEATTSVPLAGPQAEMLRLLERGRNGTYSATYRQTGPRGETIVRQVRRPPNERSETETGSGEGLRRSVTVVSATGRVVCAQQGGGPWTCENRPGRGTGAITDALSATVVAQISRLKVEPTDAQVAGQETRCFNVSGGEGPPAEMCLTRDGVLARVVAGDTRLEMTELDRSNPPDSAFVPPAPPSPTTGG